jgi:hypothetical protein
MPSYVEELAADSLRLRIGLEGLIAQESKAIARLEHDLAVATGVLDKLVLKLVLFSETFGRMATDTTLVQRDAEDANTTVIELTNKLEKERRVLSAYQKRLEDVASGQPFLGVSAPAVEALEEAVGGHEGGGHH